ncbi:MAG: hypothetical protein Q7R94_02900 [bacterium]|nr:hypothetical protein [bacterium]
MVEFLKKLREMKPTNLLKAAGLGFLAIALIAFALRLVGSSFSSVLQQRAGGGVASSPSLGAPLTYDSGVVYEEGVSYGYGGGEPAPSAIKNIYPIPPDGGFAPGEDAEEFEVTEYRGTIETRQLDETCAALYDLKARDYVIFESVNQYDKGCDFTFKVLHANVEEVLGIVKGLDPRELSENTYTIKKQIEYYANETEILEKKLDSINKTLDDAVRAYDDITKVATRMQDAESLAKIIDSKIVIIERLTQERVNVSTQLDRLERSKAEQMDRTLYTYFYINIREDKFIDGKDLKDSWKTAIRNFVRDVNDIVQSITINLASFLLFVLQYAIYLLILVFAAKYGWRLVQYIWRK